MSGSVVQVSESELVVSVEARERFIELVRADPYTGLARASAAAGIPGTRGQRKRLVAADAEIQEAIAEARTAMLEGAGLGVRHLFSKLAHVVDDDGNASQLRAIQTALHLHGVSATEATRVEHTGDVGAALEVTVKRDYGDELALLEQIGLVRRAAGAADAEVDAGAARPALLPARTD